MKYNSISRRRERRRQRFENLVMSTVLIVGFITIAAVLLFGIWTLISFINISANVPDFYNETPTYWRYNLIILLLEHTGK